MVLHRGRGGREARLENMVSHSDPRGEGETGAFYYPLRFPFTPGGVEGRDHGGRFRLIRHRTSIWGKEAENGTLGPSRRGNP